MIWMVVSAALRAGDEAESPYSVSFRYRNRTRHSVFMNARETCDHLSLLVEPA